MKKKYSKLFKKKLKKKKFTTKRLGPQKFLKPEVVVMLSNQIPDKLSNLKFNHDLIRERFIHLQRRNIIEARVPFSRWNRRYKKKYMEKYPYKEFNREQEKQYAETATGNKI